MKSNKIHVITVEKPQQKLKTPYEILITNIHLYRKYNIKHLRRHHYKKYLKQRIMCTSF